MKTLTFELKPYFEIEKNDDYFFVEKVIETLIFLANSSN
jgi:hypothetical protein